MTEKKMEEIIKERNIKSDDFEEMKKTLCHFCEADYAENQQKGVDCFICDDCLCLIEDIERSGK